MLKLIVIVSLFASLSIAMTPKKVRLECGTKEGPRGPPGPPGKRGPGGIAPLEDLFGVCRCKGNKGDPGVIGLTGVPGIAGDPGEPGRDGPIGPPGLKGIRGEQRVGIRGVTGLPGTNGRPGLKGESGENGFGFLGQKGDRGFQGRSGNQGLKGEQGDGTTQARSLEGQVVRLTARVNELEEAIRNGRRIDGVPELAFTERTTALAPTVSSCQCQTNILQFPRGLPRDYIECSDPIPELAEGTFCVTINRPSRGSTAIFNYRTDREPLTYSLHITESSQTIITFTILGLAVSTEVDRTFAVNKEGSICAWFNSRTADAGIYINGATVPLRSNRYEGQRARGIGTMVFGQLYNHLSSTQNFFNSFSFMGTISNFVLYPRVLNEREARTIQNCQCPPGRNSFCSTRLSLITNGSATVNPSK